MKIAFVSSEMVPFAKTGGLADVTGTLSREILLLGHELVAFLPRYKMVNLSTVKTETLFEDIEIKIGSDTECGKVLKHVTPEGMTVYLIEHKQFFHRDELYGTVAGDFPDNDKRFIFFQRAVLETLKRLKWKPEIIHCHDWHTGLIPVYLKTLYTKDAFFQKTRTVFTIHNLAYQGNFPPDSMPLTGLGWEHFTMDRLEFYGKLSFMKGGILDADRVTTVSERYAREIQTQEFGCGLEGVLVGQHEKLLGIVNGIDPKEWEPGTDKGMTANFTAENLDGKTRCKAVLQKENGLDIDPKAPLVGVISRLVDQKGIDILIESMERMFQMGAQLILLGTGEEKYHRILREVGRKKRGQSSIHILFDTAMAKKIYAGSDMILVPSYYEPCGLSQMIALRYGTIPVVRATGGLADTVRSFDPKSGQGNGFTFDDYNSGALLWGLERAIEVYNDPKIWNQLVKNAMACDFSWTASAKKYVQLYEASVRRPIVGLK
ncbi:MAG: glycogen synthase GlgA [Candidatus Omnitrophica bacterium]|nr:glycogen synthase GlgA [Candidatus Omnitrophota bacterium]